MNTEEDSQPEKAIVRTYKDLVVWQKAVDLARQVYVATSSFPTSETYGLVAQMRRSAVSVPSNIAEGHGRGSRPDYGRFLSIALGSLFELETQLIIARDVSHLSQEDYEALADQIDEVERMLSVLTRKIGHG